VIDGLDTRTNVFATIADDRAIFLDVERDRYFKLSRAQTAVLRDGGSPGRDALIARLAAGGLATKPLEPLGQKSSGSPPSRVSAPVHAMTSLNVFGACSWANHALRAWEFSRVVDWAHLAKHEASGAASQTLITRFLSRRPFYPRDYNCLFDALALVRFLRARQIVCDWVFGVRGAPFAAHCWVTIEGVPINDERDFVARYSTMLVA
jgi:hypothetical protein